MMDDYSLKVRMNLINGMSTFFSIVSTFGWTDLLV